MKGTISKFEGQNETETYQVWTLIETFYPSDMLIGFLLLWTDGLYLLPLWSSNYVLIVKCCQLVTMLSLDQWPVMPNDITINKHTNSPLFGIMKVHTEASVQ